MKRLALLISLVFVCCANADQVHLAWDAADPATECTDCATQDSVPCDVPVDGYRIFWGADQELLDSYFDAGDSLSATVEMPPNSYIGSKSYRVDTDCDGNPQPEELSVFSNIVFYAGPVSFLPATNLITSQNCEGQTMAQWFTEDFSGMSAGQLEADSNWNTLDPDGTDRMLVDGSGLFYIDISGLYDTNVSIFQAPTDTDDQCAILRIDSISESNSFPRFGINFRMQSGSSGPGYAVSVKFQSGSNRAAFEIIDSDGDSGTYIENNYTDYNLANGDYLGFAIKDGYGYFWDFNNSPPSPIEAWDGTEGASSNWGNYSWKTIEDTTTTSGKYMGLAMYSGNASATGSVYISDVYFGDIDAGGPAGFQAAWAKGANIILQAGR